MQDPESERKRGKKETPAKKRSTMLKYVPVRPVTRFPHPRQIQISNISVHRRLVKF